MCFVNQMRGNHLPAGPLSSGCRVGLMPCRSVDEVQLICLTHRQARARLETGGGWRRTCVWEGAKWPSFIIWRWAGRALGGWIRCRWRIPRLRPPPHHLHPTITTNRRPVPAPPVLAERRPRGPALKSRPRRQAERRPREAPRKPQEDLPPGRLPRSLPGNRPGRAPGAVPSGANRPQRRVRPNPHPGGERKRVAGGANRLQLFSPSRAMAAAQLISAM
jgi:hypothetical protein